MKINSRRKGKAAERDVAKRLEDWWSQFEPGCKFVSTPLSGGFSNPTVRGDFLISGDLMTTAKLFPFTVEVKHREKWSFDRFVHGKSSPVWAWWRQATKAAAEEKRIPMLWFRRNQMGWLVLLPEETVSQTAPGVVPFHMWKEKIKGVPNQPVCYVAENLLV